MACGGSSTAPFDGPLKLGIVSGQDQFAKAGQWNTTQNRPQLTEAVVGKLVRQANGQIAWVRLERAGNFALDLFAPRAYAQGGTIVTGSPVVGAVVCAQPLTVGSMVPWTPCTNTGADGTALFFFDPGHVAGVQKAEIRGTIGNAAAVFDTARATVMPSDTMGFISINTGSMSAVVGQTIDLHSVILNVADKYDNSIWIWATPNAGTYVPQYQFVDGREVSPAPPNPTNTGWIVTVPPTAAGKLVTLYIYAGTGAGQWGRGIEITVAP